MSRTIPAALQVHLNQSVTTTCRLLRLQLRDGRVFGVTSLDADVTYNDGRGAVTYSANQGVDVSAISASADMTVANAEAQSLLVTTPTGITEAMIEAGELRDAEWTLYLVNYRDLSAGHIILGAGDVGEVTKRWGLVWTPELLSYSVRLNQPVGTHWSRTCRAIDGSPADSQTGCGRTITQIPGAVTAVGVETDRQFTGNHAAGTFPLAPGRVLWVTGQNAGRTGFVEVHTSGAVTLGNAMPYPITAGDTYTISDTCPRTWAACVARANQLNFKGEPLIPTGDAASVSTPGAQTPRAGIITQISGATTGTGPVAPSPPTGGGSGGGSGASGELYGAYASTPYYVTAGEGFTPPGASWAGRTEGLPENITGDGRQLYGYTVQVGSFSVGINGGDPMGSPSLYTRSLTVLPAPSFTVFSAFDRNLQFAVPRFLPGPAPYLSVASRDDSASDGYRMVRGVNGRTTGKLYWEVQATTLPAGARFGAGLDASRQDGQTYDTQQLGDFPGQWGFTQNGSTALAISNSGSAAATVVAQGDRVCFAADLGTGRLWVRVNGGAWIGGGDPAAGTTPTFSGLAVPGGSFWGDFRPCALPGNGVTLTANFGSQAFAHSVPAGFSGWPWSAANEMKSQVWDSDSLAWATGDPVVYATTASVNPTGKIAAGGLGAGVTGSAASFASTGSNPSILGAISKTAGKWQFEVSPSSYPLNRARIGLVDATWNALGVNSSSLFPIVGMAAGSIGLLANSSPSTPVAGFPAKVFRAGVEVGSFTEASASDVLTFACDFDAKTVAIYRNGAIQGTYALPSGVGPWRIGMSGFSTGGFVLRTRQLSFPVPGFAAWAP